MILPIFTKKVLILPLYCDVSQPAVKTFEQWMWYGMQQQLAFYSDIVIDNQSQSLDLRRFSLSLAHQDLRQWAQQRGYHYVLGGSIDAEVNPAGILEALKFQFRLIDIQVGKERFDLEYRYTEFEEKHPSSEEFNPLWRALQNMMTWLSYSLISTLQPEEALALFERLVPESLGKSLSYFKNLYNATHMADETKHKHAILSDLIEVDSSCFLPHWEMALLEKRLKEYAKAIASFEWTYQLMQGIIPTKRALCATELGVCYALLGDTEKAMDWWKTAIFEDQRVVHPYLNIALAYEEMGNIEKAESYFQQATYRVPYDNRAYFNLARLYSKQEKWDKAIEQYERLIVVDSGNPWAYSNLANLLLQKGDLDNAKIYLQKTLSVDPEGEAGRFAGMVLSSLQAAEV